MGELRYSLPSLASVESAALKHITNAASQGEIVTQMTIMTAIGSQNTTGGSSTGVLNRLIYPDPCPTCGAKKGQPCSKDKLILPRHTSRAEGYLEHVGGVPIQRGLWLRVVATGQCTANPNCTVPHWRTIPDRAPLPAIQHLRERDQSLASWIETTARGLGRDYLDFATELLRRGAQDFRADQQEASL